MHSRPHRTELHHPPPWTLLLHRDNKEQLDKGHASVSKPRLKGTFLGLCMCLLFCRTNPDATSYEADYADPAVSARATTILTSYILVAGLLTTSTYPALYGVYAGSSNATERVYDLGNTAVSYTHLTLPTIYSV